MRSDVTFVKFKLYPRKVDNYTHLARAKQNLKSRSLSSLEVVAGRWLSLINLAAVQADPPERSIDSLLSKLRLRRRGLY